MAKRKTQTPLPHAALRKLAAEAEVDPRTIAKAARGEHVAGLAGVRARRALRAAGVLPPARSILEALT